MPETGSKGTDGSRRTALSSARGLADTRVVSTSTTPTPGRTRLVHVDNLKTVLVVWIIVGHALLGYSAVGGWPYAEINEVVFDRRVDAVLTALLGPTGLFVIGVFFFVAGLLAPGSLARKGARRYTRERLLRLGAPFLVSVLLLWPLSMWLAYRAAGMSVSFWWVLVGRDPPFDSGSLWFAEVLLLISVGWAAWRSARPPAAGARTPWRGRRLGGVVVVLTVTTFLVRVWFPVRSGQPGDLHLWWWPQCVAMFGLGVVGSSLGWVQHVPDPLRRTASWLAGSVVAVLGLVAVVVMTSGRVPDLDLFLGGLRWQALVFAVAESAVVVAGSLGLLGFAQRVLVHRGRFTATCARAAYAAFVLQGPVLLALATAARPLAVGAEVKAPLVGAAAVAVSFGVGLLLVERTPLGRLL